jgi:RHS repeat-associated protein
VTFSPNLDGTYSTDPWTLATLERLDDATYRFVRRGEDRLEFDAAGALIAMTDRNGYRTTLAYDGGQLSDVTDPSGRQLRIGWLNGRVISITDPADRIVSFDYDASGDLVASTDVGGHKTRYSYDMSHRLLGMTHPEGGVVTNTYDDLGRVLTQTDPEGGITSFSYTAETTTVTDARGNATRYRFANNLVVEIIQAVGTPEQGKWSYRYSSPTLAATSAIDPLGRATSTSYDAAGNITSTVSAKGATTSHIYTPAGDLATTTPPIGSPTTFTYDTRGNLLTESRLHVETEQQQTTQYEYGDPAHPGDVTAIVDPTGGRWIYTYDHRGYRTGAEDPTGRVTTYVYDDSGHLLTETSPGGNVAGEAAGSFMTTYVRDAHGQALEVRNAADRTLRRTYDGNGNILTVTTASGTTSYAYDEAGRQTTISHSDGTIVQFEYDAAGNVTRRSDGNGRDTTYTYDPLNRVKTSTDPVGKVVVNDYDLVGNRTRVVDRNGDISLFYFDANNQLIEISASGRASAKLTYRSDGQLATETTSTFRRIYNYDSIGRLSGTADTRLASPFPTNAPGGAVAYRYDLASRVVGLTVTAEDINRAQTVRRIDRTFDGAGRLASAGDSEGLANVEFRYDADGRLVAQHNGNGTSALYDYDAAGSATGMTHMNRAGVPFMADSYIRDGAGRTTGTATAGVALRTFAYDARDRLLQSAAGGANTTIYDYDGAQNLVEVSRPGSTELLDHNDADQLISRRFITADQEVVSTFEYDGAGNRTSQQDSLGNSTRFGFDRLGRLTSYSGAVTTAPEKAVPSLRLVSQQYDYDSGGLRTDLQWDRLSTSPPIVVADNLQNIYLTDPLGLPAVQIRTTDEVLYYHHDQIGSTRALTDDSGMIAITYTYDDWGNTAVSTTAVVNPFQYAGQYADLQTGLIYMRARWYDPATRQFMSRDPLADSTGEPYAYASNSPLDLTDPTGMMSQSPCGQYQAAGYDDNYENNDPGNYHWCRHSWRHWSRANQCRLSKRAQGYASTMSQRHGGPEGNVNAMRHCLWAATMTMDIGEDAARGFLRRHEEHTPKDHDHYVDVWNNEIGIGIGRNAESRDDIYFWCRVALWIGQLDRTGG